MEKKEVIILIASLILVGFSLYRRYIKKSRVNQKGGPDQGAASRIPSKPGDDDYEPYAERR